MIYSRQLFLDECPKKDLRRIANQLKVLNWNIAHPSLSRAHKIANWLETRQENIIILTETGDFPGSQFLSDRLESWGFKTLFPTKEKDFGVLLAFRGFKDLEFPVGLSFLPHRAPAIICQTPTGRVGIIGVYVPSSVSRGEINGKKEKFQKEFTKILADQKQTLPNLIVCGDLNVLEPSHQPHYSFLRDWEYEFYNSFEKNGFIDVFRLFYPEVCEYSWYGRGGFGYRYDHCFVSNELKKYAKLCQYLHKPRENRLSDHSAMILELDFKP